MKKTIIFALAFLLAFTVSACAKSVGQAGPDFVLADTEGNSVILSEMLKEKPALLVFWATWCPACREEAPHVQEFHEKYKDKVYVIGINLRESKAVVTNFIEKNGLTYKMVIDAGEIAREYGVMAIPTVILIDKDKKILYFGHSVSEAELKLP